MDRLRERRVRGEGRLEHGAVAHQLLGDDQRADRPGGQGMGGIHQRRTTVTVNQVGLSPGSDKNRGRLRHAAAGCMHQCGHPGGIGSVQSAPLLQSQDAGEAFAYRFKDGQWILETPIDALFVTDNPVPAPAAVISPFVVNDPLAVVVVRPLRLPVGSGGRCQGEGFGDHAPQLLGVRVAEIGDEVTILQNVIEAPVQVKGKIGRASCRERVSSPV